MKRICARCAEKFQPEYSYWALCYNCVDEAHPYGDSLNARMWSALGALLNDASVAEIEDMANSRGGQQLIRDLFDEMDAEGRKKLLSQLLLKYHPTVAQRIAEAASDQP